MEAFSSFLTNSTLGTEFMHTVTNEWTSGEGYFSYILQLLANPVFFGGAGLALMNYFWQYWNKLASWLKEQFNGYFWHTLRIDYNDFIYPYVMDYISEITKWQTKTYEVETRRPKKKKNDDKDGLSFDLYPEFGNNYFYYGGRLIYIGKLNNSTRHRRKRNGEEDNYGDSLILQTFWASRDFWKGFLEKVSAKCIESTKKELVIYEYSSRNYSNMQWTSARRYPQKRQLDSVVLDGELKDSLCSDLQDFIDSEEWYTKNGVPYRRGYLFYGPPGTGKTSFIAALASHFDHGSFVLLEDIDVAFRSRDEEKKRRKKMKSNNGFGFSDFGGQDPGYDEDGKPRRGITFSGLLNALDGIGNAHGRIVFMTTNHKEILDPALIRPGRVDCKALFHLCTKDMIEKMFKRFFEQATDEMCTEFVDKAIALEKEISPAQLQRHLTKHKRNPAKAAQDIESLLE